MKIVSEMKINSYRHCQLLLYIVVFFFIRITPIYTLDVFSYILDIDGHLPILKFP